MILNVSFFYRLKKTTLTTIHLIVFSNYLSKRLLSLNLWLTRKSLLKIYEAKTFFVLIHKKITDFFFHLQHYLTLFAIIHLYIFNFTIISTWKTTILWMLKPFINKFTSPKLYFNLKLQNIKEDFHCTASMLSLGGYRLCRQSYKNKFIDSNNLEKIKSK